MDCSTPGFPVLTISWSLLKLTCIELVMPSHHLNLYCFLLLPSVFQALSQKVGSLHQMVKYWSFQ